MAPTTRSQSPAKPAKEKEEPPKAPPSDLVTVFRDAGKKALGGGMAGALAMVVQVVALMWMRTTINYQHSKGMSTLEAMSALYAQGGIARFYQGWTAALMQAPLSRFGDTAANAGIMALLERVEGMSTSSKTFCSSLAAALFRIGITPIDTFKTILQVQGSEGIAILKDRVAKDGLLTLYSGALGSSFATLVGHYPWFIVYNYLQKKVPAATGLLRQLRSALIGFLSSLSSDTVSNSVRVVKTAKQTAEVEMSYLATVSAIIAQDGVQGLFLRGLGTKILSNGVQAMLFTICWRFFEEKIAAYQRRRALEAQQKAE